VEQVPIELRWEDGDHDKPEYAELNPQANVPMLVDGDLSSMRSLAIIEYLDELQPSPHLSNQADDTAQVGGCTR
jgi:glutathione S-transferase